MPPEAVPPLLIIDGDCPLCCASARWILARLDAASQLRIATRSDPLLRGMGIVQRNEAVLYLRPPRAFAGSDAVLQLTRELRAPWRLVGCALAIARPLRDAVYHTISRRRFRWFGRAPGCALVDPRLRAHIWSRARP